MLNNSFQAYLPSTLLYVFKQGFAKVKPKADICFAAFCSKTNKKKKVHPKYVFIKVLINKKTL